MTYWVDPTRPDDTGDGMSLLTAKKTIPAGLALLTTKGDILNLVNSGDHDWPLSASETDINSGAGTDFTTDPGYTIRGVDSSENPALISIKPAGADGVRRMVRFRSGSGYNIFENLIFDSLGKVTDTNSHQAIRMRDNGAGPVLIRYSAMLGGPSGTMSAGTRELFEVDSIGSSTETFQIEYCYFQNADSPLGSAVGYGGGLLKTKLDHCVFIYDDTSHTRAGAFYNQGFWATTDLNVVTLTYNTIYEEAGGSLGDIFFYQPNASIDVNICDCHSNFLWRDGPTATSVGAFMRGSPASTGVTHSGTIDYNVLLGGPNLDGTELLSYELYQLPWDANDDDAAPPDTQPNDVVEWTQANTAKFNDPSTTFDWEMPNGLMITIARDLRPIAHKAAGLGGTAPGALPPAATDYSVTVTSDRLNPEPEENVQLTIVLANSGTDAADVEVTAIIPSGLTYVSHSPTAGTYDQGTGLWDVPDLDDGTSETLIINVQVDADQGGNDITFIATQTDGNPSDDSVPANNTDSVTLSVVDTGDVGDPGGDGARPFLDVFPIYAPIWKIDVNTWMKTKKNRVERHALRASAEERSIREISFRRLDLAPTETLALNIGGIQRGRYLIMEATSNVEVSVGDTTLQALPDASFVFIGAGDFENVQLVNNSATDTATVLIGVTD